MFPIILNAEDHGYGYHDFYNKFISICEEHKAQGRALAFAFILYDFENAHLAKVLRDEDYWRGLDTLSSSYLTIFSVNYIPGQASPTSDYSNFMLHDMHRVNHSTNPSTATNRLIETYFDPNLEVKYPSVLFFQVGESKVIDYTLIQLDAQEIEESFLELKSYFSGVVDVLRRITPQNRNNHSNIFDLVEDEVKMSRSSKVVTKRVRKVFSIVELASSIVGLVK